MSDRHHWWMNTHALFRILTNGQVEVFQNLKKWVIVTYGVLSQPGDFTTLSNQEDNGMFDANGRDV